MTMPRSTPTNPPAGLDHAAGLTNADAAARLASTGPNALPEPKPEGIGGRLVRQFRNPLIYILLFALVVDLVAWVHEGARGWPVESLVIGTILLVNAALGVWQESKAEAALARLRKLAAPRTWVLRDTAWREIASTEIVEGDLARIDAGDRVPADGLLRDGHGVMIDESLLTGESLPVERARGEELLSGTLLVRGRAMLEVTRTGPRSALGRLAGTLGSLREEATPLERRMAAFGSRVARWVLLLCALLAVEGLVTQGVERWGEVFLFAVALAVAAVPEGLPAVMTLMLALGVERMAARKAVVRRLAAVESLGSVTVIVTDKTGTITENRLEVRKVDLAGDPAEFMTAIVCANDADDRAGDPLDLALLAYARREGAGVDAIRAARPRRSERTFDSGHRFQRATVGEGPDAVSYLKGAPEALLARASMTAAARQEWLDRAESHAREGYRVLGVARAPGEREDELELLGLAHFWDPPRREAAEALAQARSAGIRVIMMTGDHPATAQAIGRIVGFDAAAVATGEDLARGESAANVEIYARARPEHKLQLVEQLQRAGEIVAMTGDGVNDSPALKRADVGVAMGDRGSDVSREVADVVLLDDNFATIVAAVDEGRGIYENTQKFIRFLFSTNLSEVVVIACGVLFSALLGLVDPVTGGLLLPLTAAQILWINLVTDGLPALALTLDRNPGVMSRPPRPASAPLLDPPSVRFIVVAGLVKAALALGILGLALLGWLDQPTARTTMFHFMAIGQLLFVYPARHTTLRPLANNALHTAVAAGALLQVMLSSIPAASGLLGLAPMPLALWALVAGTALTAWGMAEAVNRVLWRR